MTENKQPMKVLAYFDGRPGHEKQTRGILYELGRLVDLEIIEIKIKRKGVPGNIAELAGLLVARAAKETKDHHGIDLLIGTGSSTHVPMLRKKKIAGVPAVTCMTPASYLRPCFDLCFVPLHDGARDGGNIVTTIGPPNCSRPCGDKDPSRGLILIGGVDKKSHRWHSAETVGQVREIARRRQDVYWTVGSSPRTPMDTVEMLIAAARASANIEFVRYEATSAGWIEQQYARSLHVWVTADSMSMVYEALSAGCKVGMLPVEWLNSVNKFKKSADYLTAHGMAVVYADWLSGREAVGSENDEPLHEARRCAEEIVKRWPPKN
ncbi:mitochondrial fission ELM1 family protein [Desulfoprunum benzoelyticum]|uniref:Nucleoside-diphosphate sugar epimerase n=1 Tax=Desulfoprunum benzoelyticum TaxID=1506996 RepID=A0A840UP90_9BACT|nr:ELM1/GtrOC1 family putative glycosyltransferase [Desulfoprunum benzoelyticum]MBB5346373.1 hypothetical protein [Desulfoprunum benzoelyticum]MBM9528628.1 mitochondrial fission ELM1 family protein [Desulfoprunum benzoelyticum]